MNAKDRIKEFGKGFIALKQEKEKIIWQSVLIVDNGRSWIGHLESAVDKIQKYFPHAKITILTFADRKDALEKRFSTVEFNIPPYRLRPGVYQIALQMLKLRRSDYDFILLLSLDVSHLICALFFFDSPKTKVFLYNQWDQCWSLRLRCIKEIFKVSYRRKRTRYGFKNFLRRLGLFFVLLQRRDEEMLKHSILLVDSSNISFEHIDSSVQRIKKFLPGARISILSLEQRKALNDKFPELRIINPEGCLIKKYQIARYMLKLKRNRYDYIVLLSLDITPIIISMFSMKGEVLLFNKWQQWWSLKPKSAKAYLAVIPRCLFNILTFVYLLGSVSWIFLKRSFNVFTFSLLRRRA